MDERTFTCAMCRGTFNCGWSEEEAEAEYRALFPDSAAGGAAREVVCDDCHKIITAEYPPEQFEAEERALRVDRERPVIGISPLASVFALAALLDDMMAGAAPGREPRGVISLPEAIDPPRIVLNDRPRKFDRRGVIPPKALRRRDWH